MYLVQCQLPSAGPCGHLEISRITPVMIICGGVDSLLRAATGTVCVPRKQMIRASVVHDSSSVSDCTRPWVQFAYPGYI